MGVADRDSAVPRRASAPLIEDLPLSRWDRQEPPAEPARRRPPRWRRALPLVVCSLFACVLVAVVAAIQTRPGAVGAADRPGADAAPDPRDNALLTLSVPLPSVACSLPELGLDPSALQDYYDAEIRCLEQAWTPVLAEVGATVSGVSVRLDDDPSTRCGALPPATEATGLYCHLDDTIYLPHDRVLASLGPSTEAHLATVAHEYGHHVQRLSGILDMANRELGSYERDSPQDHELHRRVELQANCFAGLFLASASGRGSISAADAEAAVNDFRNWVDSDTHGSSETQLRWARAGFDDGTVATCDTWAVPSSHVL
ncbi:neutral zinc metallopeptidase [Prauserella cavernicola]|uniref:Neutral zinc metallopeptidase n=1 Tax=Prauserella cavernicola TaxID=2800127 RepID=A0A934QUH8_9PSEU|nr:neutral zinc metallopeptidase [Prauserella cavernicola]MBK1786690.1 neutral zinc metallopeptidase [Prauserella cavernicola]